MNAADLPSGAAPIAADTTSNRVLEAHAEALGGTDSIRNAMRLAYSLGKCDGAIAGLDDFSKRMAANRELAKAAS